MCIVVKDAIITNMKKNKRYKSTSLRDKRSIVRALNTFSQQYEYILCEAYEIDLNKESVVFNYEDNKSGYYSNIVYSATEASIDLADTELIIQAIDNLMSINRKLELKNKLKETVYKRDFQGKNTFFNTKSIELSIAQIEEHVKDENFAYRLYNQLKNRIMFYRSGVYSDNSRSASVKGKKLFTKATNSIQIFEKQLKYVLENLFLFTEEIKSKVEELKQSMNKEKHHIYYDSDVTPTEDSSSLFHPIDEEAYYDADNKNKQASMTTQMIHREMYGLYDEDLYREYYDLAYNYDETVDNVLDEVIELYELLLKKEEVLDGVKKANKNINNRYIKFFNELEDYKGQFLQILRFETDIDMFKDMEKLLGYTLSNKQLVNLQSKIKEYAPSHYKKLKDIPDYILEELIHSYGIGSSLQELIYACYFKSPPPDINF